MTNQAYKIGQLALNVLIAEAVRNPAGIQEQVENFDKAYDLDYFEAAELLFPVEGQKDIKASFQQNEERILCQVEITPNLIITDNQAIISREHIPATLWQRIAKDNDLVGKPLDSLVMIDLFSFNPVVTSSTTSSILGKEKLHYHYDLPEMDWDDLRLDILSKSILD